MSQFYTSMLANHTLCTYGLFQGCYKDGTEPGTTDCRWFSSVPFLVRFIIFAILALIVTSPTCLSIMVLVATALLVITVDPFKPKFKHYSTSLVVFILLLASLLTCNETQNYYVASVITLIQLVYFSVLIVNWIISHRKFGFQFMKLLWNVKMAITS